MELNKQFVYVFLKNNFTSKHFINNSFFNYQIKGFSLALNK